jgi:beta-mannosidase
VLFEKTQPADVPALSSRIYASFDRQELLKGSDAQHAFAVFDLVAGGSVVSRNVYLFERTRNLDLPSPKIISEVTAADGGYNLKLTSPVLARNVFVSFGDADVDISDNYFDLLPNEAVTVHLKSKTPADQIQRAMRVQNIVDAFSR